MGLNTIEKFKDELGDVQRSCDDCLVTHLPMNCSNNLENTHTRDKGKSPLHVVNVIPWRGRQRPTNFHTIYNKSTSTHSDRNILRANCRREKKTKTQNWREHKTKLLSKSKKEQQKTNIANKENGEKQ